MATITKRTQIGLLVAALIGGAIAAAATRSAPRTSSVRHAPEVVADLSPAEGNEDRAPSQPATVSGKVSETIQVPNYTYLRLDTADGRSTWAAVNSAPNVKRGDTVRVGQAQLMQNFHSSSLNRDFESIYFGVLDGTGNAGDELRAPGMANPHAGPGMEASAMGQLNPHAQVPAAAADIKVSNVPKAKGDYGYTIAEVYAKKAALVQKPIRVRAVVVKSTPDVMGKTFVHVRDGSQERNQALDLTVTTQEKPELGQTLVFEGKLQLDVDLGAGYKYPLILQDARVVTE
jgi:hypothetical protein